jgi:hypothetical protein
MYIFFLYPAVIYLLWSKNVWQIQYSNYPRQILLKFNPCSRENLRFVTRTSINSCETQQRRAYMKPQRLNRWLSIRVTRELLQTIIDNIKLKDTNISTYIRSLIEKDIENAKSKLPYWHLKTKIALYSVIAKYFVGLKRINFDVDVYIF